MTTCERCQHLTHKAWSDGSHQTECSWCGQRNVYRTREDAKRHAMRHRDCQGYAGPVGHKDPDKYGNEPQFWKPTPGKTPTIKLMKPENVVECVDNTGIEDQFDEGIEYIFENRTDDMISVYDRTGTLRECFAERFRVKSSGDLMGMKKHFV